LNFLSGRGWSPRKQILTLWFGYWLQVLMTVSRQTWSPVEHWGSRDRRFDLRRDKDVADLTMMFGLGFFGFGGMFISK
jgi:hypothetical protein